MTNIWITSMSTHPESVLNPLIGACEDGFVPNSVELLSNPSVSEYESMISSLMEDVMTAYGNHNGDVAVRQLSSELEFAEIVAHFLDPIEEAGRNDTVAVDITPGRKFMSAIAFQTGMSHGADHVCYNHLDSDEYFGKIYSVIPRTATTLIDFAELLDS
jgi:hypothetical protein